MPVLRIENLTKTFPGARVALDSLSLEIQSGELLVLLGPSGSGKTTTLRLIAGLETPSAGRILLNTEEIQAKPPQARSIGMAFQNPALLPHLPVSENIALGPKLRGVSGQELLELTRSTAALLGISDLLARFPETLSGGQQQRVALARALAHRPQLFLLDEPLASLDPISRNELRSAVRDLQRKLAVTTVYVTHDQAEAAGLADRIAILHEGRLLQLGSPAELYTNPASLFVARFFAPEPPNLLSSEDLHSSGLSSSAPENAVCVVRPRRIQPGAEFSATILAVTHTGWSTSATLTFDSLTLRAELPHMPELKPGGRLEYSIDPASLLFFDRNSGRRI